MIRFALKGLLGRKLRTALTAFAIVLGVAMISGSFVLTDSISSAFHAIFTESYRGTDAVITGKSAFGNSSNTVEPSFDESLLAKVKQLPDVRAALGGVGGDGAHLIGKDGKSITFGGAPNLGFSVDPAQPEFNSLSLVAGAWPTSGQVVIDRSTANKKHIKVGDTIGVQVRGPVEPLRVSGLVKFGTVSTIGGATLAGFDLPTAQRLFGREGELDDIRMAAKPGISPAKLVAEVRQILPPGTQVRTGDSEAESQAKDTDSFLSILQKILLAFGFIVLFVAAFVIVNSLSITVAQRTREFATLRTLGASRRQVLRSVILEALVIGALASLLGLFLGLALAKGLFSLFDSVGFTLPNNGLVFQWRTVIFALVVGIGVTLLASLRPALRATRVPPIAAVREGSTLPPGRFARFRTLGAGVLAALGFLSVAFALFASGLGTTKVLVFMIAGALLLFIGVALFSSSLVGPVAAAASPLARWAVCAFSALVWPFFSLPFWLIRNAFWGGGTRGRRIASAGGVVGGMLVGWIVLAALSPYHPDPVYLKLLVGLVRVALLGPTLVLVLAVVMEVRTIATSWRPEWPAEFPSVIPDASTSRIGAENSRRNPQRTASTAAALMIGLALVTLVATLAAGIIQPFRSAVNDLFTADYAVTAQNNFSPIPPSAAAAAAQAPGVIAVSSIRGGDGQAFGKTIQVTGVEPNLGQVMRTEWKQGSAAVFGQLGADGAFVDDSYAKSHQLTVGSPISLLTPTGKRLRLVVRAIYKPPTGGSPFGSVTISKDTFDRNYQQPQNLFSFVTTQGGESDANTRSLEAALKTFPNAKVATRKQFINNQISGIQSLLNVLYVLLGLAVVVSFFGIVNTLVLTVYERTREIGMLRAIGMTQRQVRRMIRHESVITALMGAVLGVVLGLVLGGLLAARVDEISFVLAWQQLLIFVVVAILVGIVAAILPARRAARLNALEALQYE